MKRRKGRLIDHTWQFVKYKGDAAHYARCRCGFGYACYNMNKGLGTALAPEKLYNYCPICGARKTRYSAEVKRIGRFMNEKD